MWPPSRDRLLLDYPLYTLGFRTLFVPASELLVRSSCALIISHTPEPQRLLEA